LTYRRYAVSAHFGFFDLKFTQRSLAEALRMTIVDRSHPDPKTAARSSCLIETAMRLKHLPQAYSHFVGQSEQ
jgi:hypothetical protein